MSEPAITKPPCDECDEETTRPHVTLTYPAPNGVGVAQLIVDGVDFSDVILANSVRVELPWGERGGLQAPLVHFAMRVNALNLEGEGVVDEAAS